MKTIKIKDTHVVVAHIASFRLGSEPVETLSSIRPKTRRDVFYLSLTGGETIEVRGDDAAEAFKAVSGLFA